MKSLTECPYCHKMLTTEQTSCPRCGSRIAVQGTHTQKKEKKTVSGDPASGTASGKSAAPVLNRAADMRGEQAPKASAAAKAKKQAVKTKTAASNTYKTGKNAGKGMFSFLPGFMINAGNRFLGESGGIELFLRLVALVLLFCIPFLIKALADGKIQPTSCYILLSACTALIIAIVVYLVIVRKKNKPAE